MNCKAGDLAIIVRSFAGNEGSIVRCVEYVGVRSFKIVGDQPTWKIDRKIKTMSGYMSDLACDEFLKPIRDSDDEDEMLRIAGLPKKETA